MTARLGLRTISEGETVERLTSVAGCVVPCGVIPPPEVWIRILLPRSEKDATANTANAVIRRPQTAPLDSARRDRPVEVDARAATRQ